MAAIAATRMIVSATAVRRERLVRPEAGGGAGGVGATVTGGAGGELLRASAAFGLQPALELGRPAEAEAIGERSSVERDRALAAGAVMLRDGGVELRDVTWKKIWIETQLRAPLEQVGSREVA